MNFGERQSNDVVKVSPKTIVIRVAEDIVNKLNQQQDGIRKGVGSFSIQNTSLRNKVMYKIKNNRHKIYRVSPPFNLIEANQIVYIDVDLVDTQMYTQKDRFEINYLELTDKFVQIYKNNGFQNIQEYWQYIEQNKNQFPIKSVQINAELQEGIYNHSQSLQQVSQMNYQHQFSMPVLTQTQQFQSNSPSYQSNSSQSYYNARPSKNSVFYSTRGNKNTSKQIIDQGTLQQSMQSQDKFKMTSQTNGNNQQSENLLPGMNTLQMNRRTSAMAPGNENDYKYLYEKLVIKVDEQDKQLFVLNQERKKLDQDWKLLNKKQEQLKNSEFQDQKLKNINGIKPISAIIIALISILVGIYMGN